MTKKLTAEEKDIRRFKRREQARWEKWGISLGTTEVPFQIKFTTCSEHKDESCGFIERHKRQGKSKGQWCVGSGLFNMPGHTEHFPGRPVWNLVNSDRVSLTISPSILCRRCGIHGFVTDGKWVHIGYENIVNI